MWTGADFRNAGTYLYQRETVSHFLHYTSTLASTVKCHSVCKHHQVAFAFTLTQAWIKCGSGEHCSQEMTRKNEEIITDDHINVYCDMKRTFHFKALFLRKKIILSIPALTHPSIHPSIHSLKNKNKEKKKQTPPQKKHTHTPTPTHSHACGDTSQNSCIYWVPISK